MFQLTRQEQLIVAFIMLALIVGAIVRLYRHDEGDQTLSSPVPHKNHLNHY